MNKFSAASCRLALALICICASSTVGAQTTAPTPSLVHQNLERLRASISSVIPNAQGVVGVSIKHLESGASVSVNGDQMFPMASTYKVPLLVELHAMAKDGRLKWDEIVEVTPRDQHLGSGDLTRNFDAPGIQLSLRNLANLMMIISDNSATDMLLKRAGAANVEKRMRTLGIEAIRIDRSTHEMNLDYQGRDTAKLKDLSRDELHVAMRRDPRSLTVEARFANDDRFGNDSRDGASPNATVALLEKIWRGEAVDRGASDAMLELMKRCRTGENRLRGYLPAATVVAHKTGSFGGVINDVGIIYLPGNAGHIAIAVFTKSTRVTSEEAERVLAHIGRYAYDYFLFTAENPAAGAAGPQQ